MTCRVPRGLLLASLLVLLSLATSGIAIAQPQNGLCSNALIGRVCETGQAFSDAAQSLGGRAQDVFQGFTPQGIVEEWASSVAKSSAEVLAQAQQSMILAGQPDFTAGWWVTRYAVTFGIGIVVMAVTITVVFGRLAGSGVDGTQLAKQTGLSAPLYVPIMALAPAALDIVVQMIYQLAAWFGEQATADIGTAVESYVGVLERMPDANSLPGGAVLLLLVSGVTFLAALLAVVETTVATFGAQLIMLLLPIVAAIGIYPPARRRLWQLTGVLFGLLLTPVLLFLAWWVVWGAAASLFTRDDGGTSPWSTMLFVAVGSLVAVSSPAVLGMLGPAVGTSLAGSSSSRLRSNTSDARRTGQSAARSISQKSAARSSSASAGGGAAVAKTGAGVAAGVAAAGVAGTKKTQHAAQQRSNQAHDDNTQPSSPGSGQQQSRRSGSQQSAPPQQSQQLRGQPSSDTTSGPPNTSRRGDQSGQLPVNNGGTNPSRPGQQKGQ